MAEELLTVNDEMKSSVEALIVAKGDLENLIASTEIATLVPRPRAAHQVVHAADRGRLPRAPVRRRAAHRRPRAALRRRRPRRRRPQRPRDAPGGQPRGPDRRRPLVPRPRPPVPDAVGPHRRRRRHVRRRDRRGARARSGCGSAPRSTGRCSSASTRASRCASSSATLTGLPATSASTRSTRPSPRCLGHRGAARRRAARLRAPAGPGPGVARGVRAGRADRASPSVSSAPRPSPAAGTSCTPSPSGATTFAFLFTDVTERREAANALAASTARAAFRAALADSLRLLSDARRGRGRGRAPRRRLLRRVARPVHERRRGRPRARPPRVHAQRRARAAGGRRRLFRPLSDRRRRAPRRAHVRVRGRRRRPAPGAGRARGPRRLRVPGRARDAARARAARITDLLAVHHTAPRPWPAAEVALAEDVAERSLAEADKARTEAALAEREERYRTLFESIDEGFALCEFIVDAAGRPCRLPVSRRQPGVRARSPACRGRSSAGRSASSFQTSSRTGSRPTLASRSTANRFGSRTSAASLGRAFDVYATPVDAPESAPLRRRLYRHHRAARGRGRDPAAQRDARGAGRRADAAGPRALGAARRRRAGRAPAHRARPPRRPPAAALRPLDAALDVGEAPGRGCRARRTRHGHPRRGHRRPLARSRPNSARPSCAPSASTRFSRGRPPRPATATASRSTVVVEGEPEVADGALRILLYQSLREILFNVVKHAGAAEARLVARTAPDGLTDVCVEDDGPGFDPDARSDDHPDGFGLFSVRERLTFAGGRFTVVSAPGAGTRVTLSVPASRPAPDSP